MHLAVSLLEARRTGSSFGRCLKIGKSDSFFTIKIFLLLNILGMQNRIWNFWESETSNFCLRERVIISAGNRPKGLSKEFKDKKI